MFPRLFIRLAIGLALVVTGLPAGDALAQGGLELVPVDGGEKSSPKKKKKKRRKRRKKRRSSPQPAQERSEATRDAEPADKSSKDSTEQTFEDDSLPLELEPLSDPALEAPPAPDNGGAGAGNEPKAPGSVESNPGPQPPPTAPGAGFFWTGVTLAGAGVASLAVGGLFGLSAGDVDDIRYGPDGTNVTQARKLESDSKSAANTANLLFIVGGTATLIGAGLLGYYELGQSDDTPALELVPSVGAEGASLWFRGMF